MAGTFVAAFLVSASLTLIAYFTGAAAIGPVTAVLLVVMPTVLAVLVFVAFMLYPGVRASERRRLIDAQLPYAVNYIAAMAGTGITPAQIFRDLSRERVYGEVAREFAWIHRDLELFGHDFVTAINKGISRSPSIRFAEFLQGAKTTVTSGGELRRYFIAKAEQYMDENRRRQREFLEGLGILGESYVTVVIAGPLFLIVILSVMTMVGGGGTFSTQLLLFMLVFAFLPIAHLVFSIVVSTLTPES